ncbi:bifunctional biotin operon repressor/biotin synthetase BirA [Actinobacillus equuli]|nr:bifunctional biotin operon repressor/biotin synthetase BirA [Actinobacillus equuli]
MTQAWSDLSGYQFDRNVLVCRLAYELQKILKFTRLLALNIMPSVGKHLIFS